MPSDSESRTYDLRNALRYQGNIVMMIFVKNQDYKITLMLKVLQLVSKYHKLDPKLSW